VAAGQFYCAINLFSDILSFFLAFVHQPHLVIVVGELTMVSFDDLVDVLFQHDHICD
jgi:hypothetical protein